jgi:hypothetical protein
MAWVTDLPPALTQARQAMVTWRTSLPINLQGPRHEPTRLATLASTSAGPRILLDTTERSRPQLHPIMPAPAESVCELLAIACIRLERGGLAWAFSHVDLN